MELGPEPELELIIAWLRRQAPANEVVTLVHGDFKAGNVSAAGRWRPCWIGRRPISEIPHEDLGWVTNPLRAREHSIPGYWEPPELLERWSERTGMKVNLEAVRWWSMLANLKLSIIVLSGSRAFVDGKLDRVHQSPVSIYRLMLDQIGA